MRERPILFSGAMVRAILAGEKTQSRRAVKLQPRSQADIGHHGAGMPFIRNPDVLKRNLDCPYGSAGDLLWVREAFSLESNRGIDGEDGYPPPHSDGRPLQRRENEDGDHFWLQPHYRATDPDPTLSCESDKCAQCRDHDCGPHWKPSIHMPRWACRLVLAILDVRVQRLHDITTADILAEGIRIPACEESGNPLIDVSTPNGPASFLTREHFSDRDALLHAHWAALWCSINGRASWDANPWVWALSFERVEQAHG